MASRPDVSSVPDVGPGLVRTAGRWCSGRLTWHAAAAAGVGPSSSQGVQGTAVPASSGGRRGGCAAGRCKRPSLMPRCFCSGAASFNAAARGLIKGVEPTPAPPAGPTQPRPGLRDGRGCNDWHKFQPGGSHPREPPGHRRDHGPGRSAAHTHRTWRAQRPERRSGPQRRQSRRRLQQQSGPSRGSASGPAANVAVGAGPGWAVRELQGL
ncbi:hypothetical protein NDU88_005860 [Pleurodeles waltl]|uniref:Uncharacterized protein n=1 Tax=Pleurodeles waltl TaxID=8319 RepID=A0AAV7WZ29_PLEWA|nr:hypothetical protein NDU88_005860 [Pleurodeles waltl]